MNRRRGEERAKRTFAERITRFPKELFLCVCFLFPCSQFSKSSPCQPRLSFEHAFRRRVEHQSRRYPLPCACQALLEEDPRSVCIDRFSLALLLHLSKMFSLRDLHPPPC